MKKFLKQELPFFFAVPSLVWQALFLYIPLVFLFFLSFVHYEAGVFAGFGLQNYVAFFKLLYVRLLLRSLFLALSASVICLVIGYPLAYYLAFLAGRMRSFLLFLLFIPFWTSFLLHVAAWMFVLERRGVVNLFLQKIGLIHEPLNFLNNYYVVLAMMAYCYLPFMVVPLYTLLEKFDKRLFEASYDLGATWLQTMRRVVLPLSKSGIMAGLLLVFVPSFGEFAIPELMGGDKVMFVGSLITHLTIGAESTHLAAAFTVISGIFLLGSVALLNWIVSKL